MWRSFGDLEEKFTAREKLGDVLAGMQVSPDFEYSKPQEDTKLQFVHRKTADADLYFVDNRNDRDEALDATFRIQGKAAELWHSDTGKIEPASYSIANGRTTVPLKLEPWGTVFVVFRKAAKSNSFKVPAISEQSIATVEGPWDVAFQARPWRSSEGHHGEADFISRQFRCWREIFWRNRHVYENGAGKR